MTNGGRVFCVLRYEVKYSEMTCWSVSSLLYWTHEVWCSVVYGGVVVFVEKI